MFPSSLLVRLALCSLTDAAKNFSLLPKQIGAMKVKGWTDEVNQRARARGKAMEMEMEMVMESKCNRLRLARRLA